MAQEHFLFALRLGDDSLILGQRIGEWTGHAPTLEIDLSLANIALDYIGQATYFLGAAGVIENVGRDADSLAYHRDVLDFQNCLLVEQPNGDFAQTMARQLLFSTWQRMRFERLAESQDEQIAAIAAKAMKETAYHAQLSTEWVIRLGDGTEESALKMAKGLEWHWRFIDELFEIDEVDKAMIAVGVSFDPNDFKKEYEAEISRTLRSAKLDIPPKPWPINGGRRGHHSEHLGHLLAELQYLPRSIPEAKW